MIHLKEFGGSGPVVLLLHGAGGRSEDWHTVAEPLTEDFTVIAADLPGHGRSPSPNHWSFQNALDALRALELDNPAVVGLSLGGMLAIHWGAQHPGAPGVISLDGHRPPVTAKTNYQGIDDVLLTRQRDTLQATFDAMLAMVQTEQVSMLTDISAAMAMDDVIPLLSATSCPTTVCVATHDLPGSDAFTELLSAHRRALRADLDVASRNNPRLQVIDVASTHAMHHDAPHDVVRIVRDALGSA